MDSDRNLLFGVLALQADLLDQARFVEACSAWAARKEVPLADLLVERGWLTPGDRADVEKVLDRKLKKHAGDVRASLAEVLSEPVRETLSGVADPAVCHSLAAVPPSDGQREKATLNYQPVGRERYTLTRLHARGGIGQVWLARDDDLGREVALKELLGDSGDNPAAVARFVEEAQVTGQLQHPNIVPVYELARPAGAGAGPFYTMRFVRGRTLADAIQQFHRKRQAGEAGPLALRELLNQFLAVCNAVAYAHSRGVLHRDLKPKNVVLGDFGEVIVLDWGLAKVKGTDEAQVSLLPVALGKELSREGTVQGQVLGTPSYMPPEQAEGRLDRVDERSDVYGLGAILYEILTGQPPFDGPDALTILVQVAADTPVPPRHKAPETPPGLEAVCLKALAKKSAERYASAQELAREVQRWLGDEPVTAWREPWSVKAGRWLKRHRTLVTGAAAAALVAVAGLVVVLTVQARANRDLRAANDREAARFQLAMNAIKLFHGGVSDDLLLKEKRFDALRTKLLRGAADFYGQLEDQLRDQPDRQSRAALATAYEELAAVTARIGSRSEAVAILDKAVTVRRALASGGDSAARVALGRSLLRLGNARQAVGDVPGSVALADEALALAEGLAGAEPSSEPARDLLASCLSAVGWLRERKGDLPGAMAAFERAQTLRSQLAEAHPQDPTHLSGLADSCYNLAGCLDKSDQSRQALEAAERAVTLQKQVVAADPSDVAARLTLASCLHRTAFVAGRLDRLDQKLAAHQEARALRQQLADTYPASNSVQSELAQSHHNIGVTLKDMDRPNEARAEVAKAVTIRQRLADADPAVTDYRSQLARSHYVLGILAAKTGNPGEALVEQDKALSLRQRLVDTNPEVARFQEDLGNSLLERGVLLGKAGKPAEALAALEKARAIQRRLVETTPANGEYRGELAGTLFEIADLHEKAGKHVEFLAGLREVIALLEGMTAPMRGDLYDLGCAHARLAALAGKTDSGVSAAEGRTEADRAMDALHRAVAAGYRNARKLREDTDLDALRGRADFQQLLEELERGKPADGTGAKAER